MGRRLAAAIMAAMFFCQGCDNNGMEIGNNWVDVHSRTFIIDTCTIELSSMLLDSVPTSSGGRIFAGRQRSDLWGNTSASTFMTFDLTSDFSYTNTPNSQQKIYFDSLTLYMAQDDMFCGDTSQLVRIDLHRLAQQVELNDYGELYGHSRIDYDPQPLGTHSFYPRPLGNREVEVRLSDVLGQELLDKLVDKDDDVASSDSFRKYFKGLAVTPDPSCEAILGFKGADSVCMMKLYYHTVSDYLVEHVSSFKLDTTYMFTHVDIDRTGTPLADISFTDNELPSSATDGTAFVEGMTGVYTKIAFPHLNNIRGLGDYGAVVSAKLLVYPLAGSYHRRNYTSLPANLQLYVSNESNETIGSVTDGGSDVQTGVLTYNDQFAEKTYYSFDITDFVKDQLGKIGINKQCLQMIDADYGYTLNNLAVADQSNDKKNIELHITYTVFNEK